ncbi:MAG: rRNA maturation RNase YbeY [Omnitrophica WOR_2 bacterium RIFCSPLOWO2_12_FULL_50_9]|nr:MAG: rRNA maturation RNase YbeY [Omnitrophica WOR_2 bacterium RIFCSPLOWO2_12_FULL_50_9]
MTRITKTILRYEKVRRAELGVVFVSSQKIKALNKKFLHRDYATDVLAFDLREGGISRDSKARRGELMGDIVISADTAAYNAGIYRTSLEKEIILYVIHGILHLLGYDDHRPQDIQRMRKKEQEILIYLGKKTETAVSGKL